MLLDARRPLKFMLITYLLFFFILELTITRNNVCTRLRDYYFPDNNENCYYDPDVALELPQLIEKYAGKVEIYDVMSEDGYILRLHRIPRASPKGVILMHHPLMTNSRIFIWQANNSLALQLWENGFDVWLANHRGTLYSQHHVNLTMYDFSYWNFSFHEMGLYDITPELAFIRNQTGGSKVIFYGHSLASTLGLVYASLKPKEASNYLKTMVLVATPVYLQRGTSVLYHFPGLIIAFLNTMEFLRIGPAILRLAILVPISRVLLRLFPFMVFITYLLLSIICGYPSTGSDPAFFNFDSMIYKDNFSWKTLAHVSQLFVSDYRFQMWDYGEDKNLEVYGQNVPPLYPVENISVPTLLISSYSDSIIPLEGCEKLYESLSPIARSHGHWKINGLNHLDYNIGLHRREIFVDKLVSFLLGL